MDREFEALWDTPCPDDYKEMHYWEKLGVIEGGNNVFLIWRCTQCHKCVSEHLEFL